jgi:thiamine-monophosphate kinase
VGPGDDAAVLRLGAADSQIGRHVVTCDLLADGVHFRTGREDPRRIGRKALAVNLSDLAAMAARPVAGFFAVALPRRGSLELAEQLYEGILPLAEKYELAVAGGDTNTWDGPLVISVTLIGTTDDRQPLLRSGAKPGDRLIVTGSFGGSSLGHHFDFEPRVAEAILLAERYELHAGLDCSDGLALDTSRLAAESGCGAVIDLDKVPISDAAHRLAAEHSSNTALERALGDGEDFELILALPPAEAERLIVDQPLDIPLTAIGHFIDQPGLWQEANGKRQRLEPAGFEHLSED